METAIIAAAWIIVGGYWVGVSPRAQLRQIGIWAMLIATICGVVL